MPLPIIKPIRFDVEGQRVELHDIRSQAMRLAGLYHPVAGQMIEAWEEANGPLVEPTTIADPHQTAFAVLLNSVMIGAGGFIEVDFADDAADGRLMLVIPDHPEIAQAIVAAADGYVAETEDNGDITITLKNGS